MTLSFFEKFLAMALQTLLNIGLAFFLSGPVLSTVSFVSALYLNLSALNRNGFDLFINSASNNLKDLAAYWLVLTSSFSFVMLTSASFEIAAIYAFSMFVTVYLEYRKVIGRVTGYFLIPVLLQLLTMLYCFIDSPAVTPHYSELAFFIYIIIFFIFAARVRCMRDNWFSVVSILFFWKEFFVFSVSDQIDPLMIGPFFLIFKIASIPSNLLSVLDAKSFALATDGNFDKIRELMRISRILTIITVPITFGLLTAFDFFMSHLTEFGTIIHDNFMVLLLLLFCNSISLFIGPVTFPVAIISPRRYGFLLSSLLILYLAVCILIEPTLSQIFILSGLALLFFKMFCLFLLRHRFQ